MQELSENELDISMSQGFLEEWLKDAPVAVKDNLKTLVDGVNFYRQKYLNIQEDYAKLQENYNQLAALSAGYLQMMSEQREQMNQILADGQREFHKEDL